MQLIFNSNKNMWVSTICFNDTKINSEQVGIYPYCNKAIHTPKPLGAVSLTFP